MSKKMSLWQEYGFPDAIYGASPMFVLEHLLNAVNERYAFLGRINGYSGKDVLGPEDFIGLAKSGEAFRYVDGKLAEVYNMIYQSYNADIVKTYNCLPFVPHPDSWIYYNSAMRPEYHTLILNTEWALEKYRILNMLYKYGFKAKLGSAAVDTHENAPAGDGVQAFDKYRTTGWYDIYFWWERPDYGLSGYELDYRTFISPVYEELGGIWYSCSAGSKLIEFRKGIPERTGIDIYPSVPFPENMDGMSFDLYVILEKISHGYFDTGSLMQKLPGPHVFPNLSWQTRRHPEGLHAGSGQRRKAYSRMDISNWEYPDVRINETSGFIINDPFGVIDFSSKLEYLDKQEA